MGCDCDSKLGHLHDGLRANDDIVSKALGVSELAQAAKVEVRDRELLYGEWRKLARQAAAAAERAVNGRSGEIGKSDEARAIKAVDGVMSKWADRVTGRHLADIEKIYELSHVAAAKKGYGLTDERMDISAPVLKADDSELVTRVEVSYNLVDDKMRDSLRRRQTIWIGDHYSDNVSNSVRQTVIDTLGFGSEIRGAGRVAVGKALRERLERNLDEVKVPDGFKGPASKYFEGLSAHASTTARTQSQLNTFDRLGFTVYEVVNPGDSRTCPICSELDGKQFEMSDGTKLTAKLSRAKTPAAVKRAQPYISLEQVNELIGSGKGTAATRKLAARGNSMPPFHYLCRCSVDVVFTVDAPAVPKPDSKGVVRVPKKRAAPRPKSEIPESAPDWETLQKELDPLASEWDKATKSGDYSKFRKGYEKFLDKNWGVSQYTKAMPTKDFVDKIVYGRKAGMPGAAGTHSLYNGLITIREDYAKKISGGFGKFLKKGVKPPDPVHVLTHEMVHGANRMSMRAYTGCGKVLCEASTELTARRISLDMAGNTELSPFWMGGAYQDYIRKLRDTLSDVTEWSLKRCEQEMERAALLMNTKKVTKHASTTTSMAHWFANLLPGYDELSAKQKKDLNAALLKIKAKRG